MSRILGEKRITQAELARQTGIRHSTINDIYNEIAEYLNISHLDRICEYLECDIKDLNELLCYVAIVTLCKLILCVCLSFYTPVNFSDLFLHFACKATEIKAEIRRIYDENKGRHGYRRITKELQDQSQDSTAVNA